MITQTDSCRKRSHNPCLILPQFASLAHCDAALNSWVFFALCYDHTNAASRNPHNEWESERRRAREAQILWLQLASIFSCLSGVLLSPLSSYNCFSTRQPPLFYIFSISSVSLRDVLVSRWTEMTLSLWSPDSLQLLKAHRRALLQLCNNWAVLFLLLLISAYLLGLFKISRLSGTAKSDNMGRDGKNLESMSITNNVTYKVTSFQRSDRLEKRTCWVRYDRGLWLKENKRDCRIMERRISGS